MDDVQFTFPPPWTFLDSTRFARDTTFRTYDAAGNVVDGGERAWGSSYRKVQTRSYYGADNKLRAQQRSSETGINFTGERRGYFSKYRYVAGPAYPGATGFRMTAGYRRDLHALARHPAFSTDVAAFVTAGEDMRDRLRNAITWWVGAVTIRSMIVGDLALGAVRGAT